MLGLFLLSSLAAVHGQAPTEKQAPAEQLPPQSFPPIPELNLQPLPPLLNNLDPSRESQPNPALNNPGDLVVPEAIAPPKNAAPQKPATEANPPPARKIYLADVLTSLDEFYPLLVAVSQERGIAAGELLAAEGSFDTKLMGATISQPQGFYQNYRNSLGLEQPTWNGGKVTAGYRIGDGDFAPWYGERETNEGGEFAAGAMVPFWKDRVIDKRRAELFKANIKTRLAEPRFAKLTSTLRSKPATPIGIGSRRSTARTFIESICKLPSNAMSSFGSASPAGTWPKSSASTTVG